MKKIINTLKAVLLLGAIGFAFFDWKIAVGLFILALIIHAVFLGVSLLLNLIILALMIGGIVYVRIDQKIGIMLIMGSVLIAVVKIIIYRFKIGFPSNKE